MDVEIVSFTGDSGLADYSVSLARKMGAHATVRLVTSDRLPERFRHMGFGVITAFRRTRHLPVDLLRFITGVMNRKPEWLILQGPLKWPIIDALMVTIFRAAGIKVAITVHDVLPHYPSIVSKYTYPFYYRSANKLIAHSESARQQLAKLGVQRPILVVPHGVYDLFRLTTTPKSESRALLGLPLNKYICLFFGHLESRKGLNEFVAAAQLMQQEPDFHFLLAGSPDSHDNSATYQASLQAAASLPNVTLIAKRIPFEDVEHLFKAADCVALPYREGTTSGVLKLAIAFSVPVIATNVGDFPEQVPDGAGIFICDSTNVAASLVDGIHRISASASYQLSMAGAARQADWSDIAKSYHHFLGT